MKKNNVGGWDQKKMNLKKKEKKYEKKGESYKLWLNS
jgi:hypothetical protein